MTHVLLKRLRETLAARDIGVYILPRSDEHNSEYLAAGDERVHFLTGFSGSNALVVVSQSEAFLWTDGWQLRKMMASQRKWFQVLTQQPPCSVAFEGSFFSASAGTLRRDYLQKKGFKVEILNNNLVDPLWTDRPSPQLFPLYIHENWVQKNITVKVTFVRDNIIKNNGKSAIFNDLSQIAWILNLRGNEISNSPFFKAVLVIELEGGKLYLPRGHPGFTDLSVVEHLSKAQLTMAQMQPHFGDKALITKGSLNLLQFNSLVEPIEWEGIQIQRCVNSQKEIAGFRRAHVVDGVAMARFWAWRATQESVDQWQASERMDSLRKEQLHNKGTSFETISAIGPNASIIHYRATKKSSLKGDRSLLHLLDSGGQYLDGTTDVTRVFHFGTPKPQERDAFTRVLLGNLDVERTRWPSTTKLSGSHIDVLARRHLWNVGKDYGHGTGHGVGYYASVHQSPVGISLHSNTVFQPGMIVTDQPGYYLDNQFGIRIENELLVVTQDDFLSFENLTLCPYDKNLIEKTLLTPSDIAFIDTYHRRVLSTLSPYLQLFPDALQWLQNATKPLQT